MKVIIGKTAGFCYGVKNAVEKSIEELKKDGDVCCLGEIVHNKKVVNELEEMGMQFIEKLEENTNKKNTIIRAHCKITFLPCPCYTHSPSNRQPFWYHVY